MSVWLDIIGVPESGVDGIDTGAKALIEKAGTVIGVKRRLDGVPKRDGQTRVEWDGALEEMVQKILESRQTPTVLLASGDPNWFGIGATLSRRMPTEQFRMHPCPSSFQLAAARLHWPMQHLAMVSLHGRPVERLHPHVLPGNRVLALTSDRLTAQAVADLLVDRGYGDTMMVTLENLGSTDERICRQDAEGYEPGDLSDFYVLALDCASADSAALLPPLPGLPDDAFVSDGQLTKREVRAASVAKLAPYPGALLWDVGAGCGSVAIEWMRAARDARSIAFERHPERLEMIRANALALGAPALEIVAGDAPETLADRAEPDAIFLGGDVGNDLVFEAAWAALRPGGRLVANAVTIDGEQAVMERQARLGGHIARIAVSSLDHVGTHRVMKPKMAVTQWLVIKP
ncbi:precorrin-6Y C5,15-methyltransferase (decarboxylating) [Devosia pacifica]|uniref:Precorrin-6Y C5,15-methyltransferase (Decarboxylating) n=1 Tax=Devosia pacifica TaxID=1335967 RepID=A0A918S8V7_9HYPH|nr:precorrin-6y C5,15-methyltransferase (decarboxylating) subunit CbiE [Devosia pacifica]GHA30844.1 precorrin-6Y C5,15-methyltransferase (decarboxylating) [Devosia pacifica]